MSRASYRNRKKLKKKLRLAGAGPEEFRRQCREIRREMDGPCLGSLADIVGEPRPVGKFSKQSFVEFAKEKGLTLPGKDA